MCRAALTPTRASSVLSRRRCCSNLVLFLTYIHFKVVFLWLQSVHAREKKDTIYSFASSFLVRSSIVFFFFLKMRKVPQYCNISTAYSIYILIWNIYLLYYIHTYLLYFILYGYAYYKKRRLEVAWLSPINFIVPLCSGSLKWRCVNQAQGELAKRLLFKKQTIYGFHHHLIYVAKRKYFIWKKQFCDIF